MPCKKHPWQTLDEDGVCLYCYSETNDANAKYCPNCGSYILLKDTCPVCPPRPIILTPEWWDCECDKDYIHPKKQHRCPKCKAHADDQPDSRLSEVLYFTKRR